MLLVSISHNGTTERATSAGKHNFEVHTFIIKPPKRYVEQQRAPYADVVVERPVSRVEHDLPTDDDHQSSEDTECQKGVVVQIESITADGVHCRSVRDEEYGEGAERCT